MARLGVAMQEVGEALDLLRRTPSLALAGFLSHFAEADDPASPRNPLQEQRFAEVLALLTPAERDSALLHTANSAAALHRPQSRLDLVRVGIALYGIDPLGRDRGLTPVMSVSARVVQVREVPAGTPLSYGGRTVTRRPSRIAVVPVGYADGYTWQLTGRAEALVRGRRVPVAGSVTMDMTLLDVTDVGAELGEEATLLGRQGEEEITAGELAARSGTIVWEVLCSLGQRLPRRFHRGGRAEDIVSRFRRGGT
jgi:alanine racemase